MSTNFEIICATDTAANENLILEHLIANDFYIESRVINILHLYFFLFCLL